jgi:hypothetical protein
LTLIFGLIRNFSITIFLLLGPRQVASSLHTKFAQLLATFHCSCSSMGGLGCMKDVVSIYSLIKSLWRQFKQYHHWHPLFFAFHLASFNSNLCWICGLPPQTRFFFLFMWSHLSCM